MIEGVNILYLISPCLDDRTRIDDDYSLVWPEAEVECVMTMVNDTHVEGAFPKYSIDDAEECMMECLGNPECTAIDFKYVPGIIYNNSNNV